MAESSSVVVAREDPHGVHALKVQPCPKLTWADIG